jgi:DNA (cytosine-5)-methyltransferase 1
MNSKLPSNTIDTGHRNYFHYSENRIPTARESARIQSFPDNFEFIGTKGSQYKQIGNAVPPLLANELAKKIKLYFK